ALPIRDEPSPYNLHYLAAKSRSGHALAAPAGDASKAELPERVESFSPYATPGAPSLIHMATYLLPIRPARKRECVADEDGDAPFWFRSHVYFDLEANLERVVLTYGHRDGRVPLVRVERESLLDRFPLRNGAGRRRIWQESVERIVGHGAGCAVFLP